MGEIQFSVMFIKTKITTGIKGSIEQYNKVQDLLKAIGEQLVTSDNALVSTLIMKFSSIRITSVRDVCEHIMQMRDIAAQLKKLSIDMSDVTPQFPGVPLTTVNLRKTCVSHIMRPIHK